MLRFYWPAQLDLFLSSDGMSAAGEGTKLVGPLEKISSVLVDILKLFNVFLRHSKQIPAHYKVLYQKSFLQRSIQSTAYYFDIKNGIV